MTMVEGLTVSVVFCILIQEEPRLCPTERFPTTHNYCQTEMMPKFNSLPQRGIDGLRLWQQTLPRIQNGLINMKYNLMVNPQRWEAEMREWCQRFEQKFGDENN